jgi:hypothetical protein
MEKEEKKYYYSPKVGDIVEYKKSKKHILVDYLDMLCKVGSEHIEIRPGYMKATKGHVSLKCIIQLGVDCKVNAKDFKKVVKHIEGQFSTTYADNLLIFSWGENGSCATTIEVIGQNEESEAEGLGKELACVSTDAFYQCLTTGSVGVGGSPLVCQYVHYDGQTIASTDNILASFCDYNFENQAAEFAINELSLKLWREINLPTKYICVYERGVRFMIRDDIIICDKSFYAYTQNMSVSIKDRLTHLTNYTYQKFKITEDIWKKLKMFKDCKEITISNNEIRGEQASKLKMQTSITPFPEDCDSFTIDIKQLLRVKHLVTDFSDFSIAFLDFGSHVLKYLVVEPEVGCSDLVVIGGIAEENKSGRME